MSSNYRSILNVQGSSFASTNSFTFDGNNDYIDCGHISDIQNASKVTISFWAKIEDTSFRVLLGQNLVAGTDIFQLYYWGADTLYIWIKSGNVGTVSYVNTSAIVSIGQWYNFTLVFDGTQSNDDRCKLYLNGGNDIITNRGTMPTTFTNSSEPFLIGRGLNGYFDGNIDEVAVWNTDQSANVSAIGSTIPTDLTSYNPISWWQMGEQANYTGREWVLTDQGSGGYNGFSDTLPPSALSTDVPT